MRTRPPPQFLLRSPLGGDVWSSEPKVHKVKGEEDMECKSFVCPSIRMKLGAASLHGNRYVYFILTRLFVPMRITVRRNDII